jgi:hypothetical protein
MLERFALLFGDLTASLKDLEEMWGVSWLSANPGMMTGDTEQQAMFRATRLQSTLDSLERLRAACELLKMPQLTPEVVRLQRDLSSKSSVNLLSRGPIADRLQHLLERLRDELQHEYFLHVGRADSEYYGKNQLFGPAVAAKFNITDDLEAAGNCLAVEQPTACVFHLMRIMERGVHSLGRALKVKFDPTTQTWFDICNLASKAATNRPAKTPRQRARNAALAAAAAHLQTVRVAWRNGVMHPRQSYSISEAREVYEATRTFMINLAELV